MSMRAGKGTQFGGNSGAGRHVPAAAIKELGRTLPPAEALVDGRLASPKDCALQAGAAHPRLRYFPAEAGGNPAGGNRGYPLPGVAAIRAPQKWAQANLPGWPLGRIFR